MNLRINPKKDKNILDKNLVVSFLCCIFVVMINGSPINVYIDGGCKGNGKVENYGANAYVITLGSKIIDKKVNYARNTTNNKMETGALISALEYLIENNLCNRKIIISSDSQYVVNYANTIDRLKQSNFKDKKGGSIPNFNYWFKVSKQLENFSDISFLKLKGHTGHYFNEMVDRMCTDRMNEVIRWDKRNGY